MNIFEKDVIDYMITTENSNEIALEIINSVNKQDVQANLLLLIQTMGTYLTHEDETVRSKAIGLLTTNITHCQQEKLTESAVYVLVKFYCSRLSDHACVPNLMPGLVVLTGKYKHFSNTCAKLVIKSLDNDIHVQSFPHLTRNAAFQIFENLLTHHLNDVQSLKDEFIPAFIRSMTGEKDPRNLMTVYSLIQVIVQSLDISTQVENLFDATFCYFPITFRPPPDNPYGITAKDLKLNLRKCMASTPLFSKYALPLLLQKLATTSGTAKKDALETLAACVKVYPVDELLVVGTKLYDAIKVEILNSDPDPGLREPSLNAIQALTAALASHDTQVTRVIRPLIDDCATLLEELNEDSIKPASLILRSVASASPFVYSLVESVILPKLLRQYRDNEEMKGTYLILCTMVAIIQARKIVFGPMIDPQKAIDVDHDSVLLSYKDRFIEIFSKSIQSSKDHPEVCLMGILGLGLLCVLNNFMTKTERARCVRVLSAVLETEQEEKLRNSVEMSLSEISSFDPSLIADETVSILINTLPDFSSRNCVHHLSSMYIRKNTCYEKFIYICSHNEDKKYALEIIKTCLNLIQTENMELGNCINTLVRPLLVSVVSASLDTTTSNIIILNSDIIETISLIILTVFHTLDSNGQFDFASNIVRYFEEKDLSDLGLKATPSFDPISVNVPENQAACLQIYATVMSAFRKGTKMPVDDDSFLDVTIEKALKSSSNQVVVSYARIISSLINKQDEIDDSLLEGLLSRLHNLIHVKSLSALILYIWVTKALVIRGHKKGFEMTDSIIRWIPDPVIGKQASSSFDVLIGDDLLCLNKLSSSNISPLYKQKFMTYALPKLLEKISTAATEDEKLNYLVAIAYLMKNIPKAVLLYQLPPLVLLLIDSLIVPEPILQLSTLNLFQFVLHESPDIMHSHISSLLSGLTAQIGPQQASLKVRISALKCLELIATQVSREIVLPYTGDTIKSLAIPLDDRKRLVRKQAVECREKWYLLCQK